MDSGAPGPQAPAAQAWRDLGKLAIVAAFFAVCFDLLVAAIGPRSPWLGLLLMFYFMGLAQVGEPLVRLRMPRAFRAVGAERRSSRRLGIRGFGALLRRTPLRRLNASVYLANSGRSLAALCRQAESAEAIHFWAAVLFTPYIVYVGVQGHVADGLVFVLVQVVVNVYPILHLRLVRARLERVDRAARARCRGRVEEGDVRASPRVRHRPS